MTEPIAWINKQEIKYLLATKQAGGKDWKSNLGLVPEDGDVPLYLAPPKKEWGGLFNDEVISLTHREIPSWVWLLLHDFEEKLKERNT